MELLGVVEEALELTTELVSLEELMIELNEELVTLDGTLELSTELLGVEDDPTELLGAEEDALELVTADEDAVEDEGGKEGEDVIDDDEGQGGRPDGAYFGLWHLLEKLALALAAGLALPLLQVLGYVPGTVAAAGSALPWVYALLPCVIKLAAAMLLM
jgi:hypothetical protein